MRGGSRRNVQVGEDWRVEVTRAGWAIASQNAKQALMRVGEAEKQ